jgi:hypothetical protein
VRCIPPHSERVVRLLVTAAQKVECSAVFHLRGGAQGGYASAFHPGKKLLGTGSNAAKNFAEDPGFAWAVSQVIKLPALPPFTCRLMAAGASITGRR